MASGYSDLSEIRKDGQTYAQHHKPPKINLLSEQPRRESLIEQQLTTSIVRPQLQHQQQYNYNSQQSIQQGSQGYNSNAPFEREYHVEQAGQYPKTYGGYVDRQYPASSSSGSMHTSHNHPGQTTMTVKTTTTTNAVSPSYNELVTDLTEKEAKLKREMAYLNQNLSPWARPRQTREPRREPQPKVTRSEQRWVRECPSGSSSRPTSRASSTRSTTEADLLEKAAKLLQDVEEIERKPLNTQQVLIESGARSRSSQSQSPIQDVGSLHTAIIKVPKEEIDNKSPLPFSYDNFSTLGVRGNIASFGAAEPEKPYAPIFPTIKRTPSPKARR